MFVTPFSGTLSRKQAAHLLRRATYRYDKARIDSFTGLSATEAVTQLMAPSQPYLEQPIDPESNMTWINPEVDVDTPNFRLRQYVRAWWIDECRRDMSCRSKMALYLHNTFTVDLLAGGSRRGFDHLALLRFYSLGNVKTLAQKMVVDYLMLRYLNNNVNTKNSPNENFAREFLELFTIGRGPQAGPNDYSTYTEEDIKEAARVFSGFTTAGRNQDYIDPDTGIYTGRTAFWNHDTDVKNFSYRFFHQEIQPAADADDMWRELDDFVDMVFARFETAKNYVRKLYRFFFSRTIDYNIENYFISPLAYQLFFNNYELAPVVESMLTSAHFYDADPLFHTSETTERINGAIVKSPMEIVLPTLSFFHIEVPDPVTNGMDHYNLFYRRALVPDIFINAGMDILQPTSVAGYPPYFQQPNYHQDWFNGSTIIPRYKYQQMLLEGNRYVNNQDVPVQMDTVAFAENHISEPANAETLVREIIDYLFCEPVEDTRWTYFFNDIFLDTLSPINWMFEWQGYVDSGDDSAVRIPLDRLFTAILHSQEYQIM